MSSFPRLIPAFTAQLTCQLVAIAAPISVGTVSKGTSLTVVPFDLGNGSIRSEPNYPIQIDAVFTNGVDFINLDPSGKHSRLDVNSVLKDKSGAAFVFRYSGVLKMTPGVLAVLGGTPDAKTTDFGDAFTHVLFETGDEKLKVLEEKVYVASGHFLIQPGKGPIVEYLISEVAA